MLRADRVLSKSFPLRGYRAWKRAIRLSRAVALWKAYRPRGPHAKEGPALHYKAVPLTDELRQQLLDRHPERYIPNNISEVYLPVDPSSPIVCGYRSKSGKMQYVYTRSHREQSTTRRLEHLYHIHEKLPQLEQWIERQLKQGASDQNYARTHEVGIAAILKIMHETGMRVGERRRAESGSHGAASLKPEHVTVDGDTVHIQTTGKGGRVVAHQITDPHLARVVEAHLALPSHQRKSSGLLFHAAIPNEQGGYSYRHTTADHVRRFLEGFGLDPHDIRRYHANRVMAAALAEAGKPRTVEEAGRHVREAKKKVMAFLGDEDKRMLRFYLDPAHESHHMSSVGQGGGLFTAAAEEQLGGISASRKELARTMRESAERALPASVTPPMAQPQKPKTRRASTRRTAASPQAATPMPTPAPTPTPAPDQKPTSVTPKRTSSSRGGRKRGELPYAGRLFE